jgi:hypothetical protein
VFLNDCDVAHPIVVEEINDKHEVRLHAGDQVIGVHRTLVTLGFLGSGAASTSTPNAYPLELIDQRTSIVPALVNDIFALDGDSIILANSRCASLLLVDHNSSYNLKMAAPAMERRSC